MRKLNLWWHNLSIAKKLYSVIGVMAVLIVLELFTLWFAMSTLSAVRAFVGGEGLWSKSQKDAAFSLQRYAVTRDERDYEAFLEHLKVNDGDRLARSELSKPHPDFSLVREGFLKGSNHPDDINAMTKLIRRYYNISYIHDAIVAWSSADALLIELKLAGIKYHDLIRSGLPHPQELRTIITRIQGLNDQLTVLEDKFSTVLGEGSRWLEWIVISLLSLAVLMVEGIGLSLAFYTSRSISRGLSEISSVAKGIGHGDFSRSVSVDSQDEIGIVGDSINRMGEMLQKSYQELEQRVQERTAELAKAVQSRDEFLSIASHELKTPLTSLNLQTQVRRRLLNKNDDSLITRENLEKMVTSDEKQVMRLVRLVDDMLDISRLSSSRLHLHKQHCDLAALAQIVLDRFSLNLANAGCVVSTSLSMPVPGEWDASRIEQVIENLLTNAMKYGAGHPLELKVWSEELSSGQKIAKLSVSDRGMGIAKEDQTRIFMQFERAVTGYAITGLGLGLYISNEIVKMHQGTLEVKSELGQGSVFTVTLPV